MIDIVERLRDQGRDAFARHYSLGMFKLCDEAASEIERLREILKTACTCGGDPNQPRSHHDISCPAALDSSELLHESKI